jgi:hypothetical protein
MTRQTKEVPRWRRRKTAPAGPVVVLKGRQAKAYAAQQAAAAKASGAPAGQSMPPAGLLARTGVYRFRRHLVPVWLLAGIAGVGLGCHARHLTAAGIILGIAIAVVLWLLTRHLSAFGRDASTFTAALTVTWVPVLSLSGVNHLLLTLAFASWLPLMWAWARHYRWRPDEQEPEAVVTDVVIWNRLAAKNKWQGRLGMMEKLPGGGRQYPITLDGAETHIGQVLAEPRRIAAAWGKSITEAYAEPSPDGTESRGLLTILSQNTLEKAREWDGTGISHETGMAATGWFPDGKPVHERYFIRMNGVRHTIIAGADGSGKSGLLDLGLCLSAISGIIAPVILDPQEGQALPAWKDHVPYACGVDECMTFLRGLHASMLARSRYLAGLTWTTDDGDVRKGMGFFDPFLTGLPVIEITLDEAPALLTDKKHGEEAAWILGDTGKRGRKVGYRLRFAIQVPSLAEMRLQALRSMLVGGNVICGRTGDKVSGPMIGLASSADPSQLPKYFRDGKPTVGLGYASGPDNRPGTPMRSMWVKDPYKVARSAQIRPLDERCAEVFYATMAKHGAQLAMPAAAAPSAPLAAVPAPDEEKPGRSAADAILAVLDREMDRGQIVKACGLLVQSWDPPRAAFSVKALSDALRNLAVSDQIDKTGHGSYAPRKASLHAVPQTATASNGATAR